MQKVKNYGLIVLTVFVLILGWQYTSMKDKRDTERSAKERWQGNYMDQTNIIITTKEFLKLKNDTINLLTARTHRLIDSLKIKPKTITKIVERVVIQKETDTVKVVVEKIATGTYRISDSGPCFVWSGVAVISGKDSLNVKRTGFTYENNIVDIEAKKLKRKFLFFRFYSRKEIEVKTIPECGETFVKVIQIKK